jgi:hypothetical protein
LKAKAVVIHVDIVSVGHGDATGLNIVLMCCGLRGDGNECRQCKSCDKWGAGEYSHFLLQFKVQKLATGIGDNLKLEEKTRKGSSMLKNAD